MHVNKKLNSALSKHWLSLLSTRKRRKENGTMERDTTLGSRQLPKQVKDLIAKREALDQFIREQQKMRGTIQGNICSKLEKIKEIDIKLAEMIRYRNKMNLDIARSEAAYWKIIKDSHNLLADLKKDVLEKD